MSFALSRCMENIRQTDKYLFKNTKFQPAHGGDLRNKRSGRFSRPLSSRRSHHIVFKIIKSNLRNRSFRHPKNFITVQKILKKYAKMFNVKIEQISYQHDHIHIRARSERRSNYHYFFRVFTGQIAQQLKVTDTPDRKKNKAGDFEKIVLWKTRPFTRIIKGLRHEITVRNYIQLNECEINGIIPYRKTRLRGLTVRDWIMLWIKPPRDRYPLGNRF